MYIFQILINDRVDLWVAEGTVLSQITGDPRDATASIVGITDYSSPNSTGLSYVVW